MGKATEIEVKVKAKLDVDIETAFACLKLAAIYANNNGLIIKRKQTKYGDHEYCFGYEREKHGKNQSNA